MDGVEVDNEVGLEQLGITYCATHVEGPPDAPRVMGFPRANFRVPRGRGGATTVGEGL